MDRHIVSSLMEEAIASSQLEGATTTRKVAKEMLRSGRRPKTIDERMILNNYRAMQEVSRRIEELLTPKMICDLHKCITKGVMNDADDEGRFREDDDVVVIDPFEIDLIYHTPPKHDMIGSLINDLCRFSNTDDGDFVHPLIKGIVLHFMIGFIHPFNDGNGRLGRTLLYWYAMKNGYWLFECMAISKAIKQTKRKYGLSYLYTESDDNDLTYFINYNLHSMEKALQNLQDHLERKAREQQEAIKLSKGMPELNFRQAEILREMIRHDGQLYTAKVVASKFAVTDETARTDLKRLVSLNKAKVTKSGRLNYYHSK